MLILHEHSGHSSAMVEVYKFAEIVIGALVLKEFPATVIGASVSVRKMAEYQLSDLHARTLLASLQRQ